MTIISSSIQKQEECKNAVSDHVKKSTAVCELLQQGVLKKWTQPALNTFYKFCLNMNVVLEMNINIGYLKLFGSKESVKEAENEYLREQVKQSEQARLTVIARNIIWAYKVDENHWEKYLPELNAHIEDQHLSKIPTVSHYRIKRSICSSPKARSLKADIGETTRKSRISFHVISTILFSVMSITFLTQQTIFAV
jgi:hypothetical protein